jgi:hypothetical protein
MHRAGIIAARMRQHRHRSCRRLQLSISRMLDLGGAPSGSTDQSASRTVNASKNCRLQVVAFDVHTLTRSLEQAAASSEGPPAPAPAEAERNEGFGRPPVLPDATKVQTIASILGVSLGGTASDSTGESRARGRGPSKLEDDLSPLTGGEESGSPAAGSDIRSKYAAKLSQRGAGGVEGVRLARQQAEDQLKRGDAAGHWAARKLVASSEAPPASGGGATKWMAQTGTGRLLQYLTRRSLKIALVPSRPDRPEEESAEGGDMLALQRQLQKDVVFDALVRPDPGSHPTPDDALRRALAALGRGSQQPPSSAMLVSSREEHLRAAKEEGWVTCRVRPKNAPRGNVSTHYTVEAVPDVRQVVDEINGISYSAVMSSR